MRALPQVQEASPHLPLLLGDDVAFENISKGKMIRRN